MKRRSAFTLVELLVVSIIALLIAMLLPALNKAVATAKSVRCMSNLRQQGFMYQVYAHDWNDLLPRTYWDELAWPDEKYSVWSMKLSAYGGGEGQTESERAKRLVDNRDTPFACPAAIEDHNHPGAVNDSLDPIYPSYGQNEYVGWAAAGWNDVQNQPRSNYLLRMRDSQFPSETCLTGDRSGNDFNLRSAINDHTEDDGVAPWQVKFPTPRHQLSPQGMANFLYFDGHAQSLEYESIPPDWDVTPFWLGGRTPHTGRQSPPGY